MWSKALDSLLACFVDLELPLAGAAISLNGYFPSPFYLCSVLCLSLFRFCR